MKLAAVLPAIALALALVPPGSHAAEATPPPAAPATDETPAAAAIIIPAGDTFSAARQAMLKAVYQSTDSITAARARLEALANADPKSAERHYWVALADYRLAPRVMQDPKLGTRYCKDGIQHADAALKIDPKFAEALALKAGIEGLSITLEPARAMALGSQIGEELGQAMALAPKNPRVALFAGINTYHVPKFVGGGPEKALPRLKKAQDLFAAEKPAGPDAISWGADDAFLWAGRASVQLKKYDDARVFYYKALAVNPSNVWVKDTLLPEVDRLAKDKP